MARWRLYDEAMDYPNRPPHGPRPPESHLGDATTGNEVPSHTLQELADLTGMEPRTIRSYIERGLLSGPESLGRGARYSQSTLDRLRVIQLLRDAKRDVTLEQLRVVLQSLSPAQIAGMASGAIRIGALIDTDAGLDARAGMDNQDALSYLRTIRAAAGGPSGNTEGELSALAHAAEALTRLVGMASPSRGVRAEGWHRLALTPDIELHVRGQFGPEELAQFHRIGDALRVLLTKGAAR